MGTPISSAAAAAMAMPLASTVRILFTPQPENSRAISCPMARRSAVSICWLRKLPTLSTPPGRTCPSRRIFSSNRSMRRTSAEFSRRSGAL